MQWVSLEEKKLFQAFIKFFIRIRSLDFIIKRVSSIAVTYYSGDIIIEVIDNSETNFSLLINGFYVGQELMMPNIAG